MEPIEELKAEHRAIEEMLAVLERVCDRLEAGITVDPDHLDQMLEFFKTFADTCHHGKEEDFLFPAMAAAGVPVEDGPIGPFIEEHEIGRRFVRSMSEELERYRSELLDEHGLGRRYVESMREAAAHYRAGEKDAGLRFAENGRDYVALLTGHIEREDTMLFPIADAHLSDEQREELAVQFETVEREKMGAGTHQALHEILDRLTQVYVDEPTGV